MNKNTKLILGIFTLIILAIGFVSVLNFSYVDIYLDGESVETTLIVMPFLYDANQIADEINDYVLEQTRHNYSSNITTLEEGIKNITKKHGINNAYINIDSVFGKNQIPILFTVKGESMIPTLESGQKIIVLKTKDIHVGDIVVSNTSEHGLIVKRVSTINGNEVYLISDNKNIETVYINGISYRQQGLNTWSDLSEIVGIVKIY